jgi:hypothetical protein
MFIGYNYCTFLLFLFSLIEGLIWIGGFPEAEAGLFGNGLLSFLFGPPEADLIEFSLWGIINGFIN